MKCTKISKIMMTLFGLVLCFGPVGLAEPVGTAFTYQGRLIDSNQVADGLYDFQFKLYDANSAGNKLGLDVNKPEVDVIDGYFTAELDFGSAFTGNNSWLEIGVRPGVQNDPCVYTLLSPRQKVTPAPYALYAVNSGASSGGGSDNDWIFTGDHQSIYSGVPGFVGIGTTDFSAKLNVVNSNSGATAIYGQASDNGTTNYGGRFYAAGSDGRGVYGEASGCYGYGVYGKASNSDICGNIGGYFETLGIGMGVFGRAGKTGDYATYGGYFDTAGNQGKGVYGNATGNSGYGIYGEASNTGTYTNYGGYFKSAGGYGRGIYAEATNSGDNGNFGGEFYAAGGYAIGVKGAATNPGNFTNYGGYFTAAANSGCGIYAGATNSGNYTNYGGNFIAAGSTGRGVQATAMNTGSYINYGGWFGADGAYGRGVYGEASNGGNYGNYGGWFKAAGAYGAGIYGYATHTTGTNYGIYAKTDSPNGYAGYFWGGKNYFQGFVGIGTTTPERNLHISDVMRLQPRSTAPSSPAEGDIYMDSSTHKLMVYDGTAWQACW